MCKIPKLTNLVEKKQRGTVKMDRVLDDVLMRVQSAPSVWDAFQAEVAAYHSRPAGTLAQIRSRDDKKRHGDLWELFCVRYILQHWTDVRAAWLFNDIPAAVRATLSLGCTDMGIDIVAVDVRGSYWAVQCKWRAPDAKKRTYISWAQLSTFYALAARTGPYAKHLVLTNAAGARHVGARQAEDETVASDRFAQLPRDAWVNMIRTLNLPIPQPRHNIQFIRDARIKALS